jgi:hypothetical protein
VIKKFIMYAYSFCSSLRSLSNFLYPRIVHSGGVQDIWEHNSFKALIPDPSPIPHHHESSMISVTVS